MWSELTKGIKEAAEATEDYSKAENERNELNATNKNLGSRKGQAVRKRNALDKDINNAESELTELEKQQGNKPRIEHIDESGYVVVDYDETDEKIAQLKQKLESLRADREAVDN